MRTSKLEGDALVWAVGKCEWYREKMDWGGQYSANYLDWSQAGPIIERENIHLQKDDLDVYWWAKHPSNRAWINGPTPLIAAMRCYVASKLGEDIDIPKGLV
jgi:hypothetical protein